MVVEPQVAGELGAELGASVLTVTRVPRSSVEQSADLAWASEADVFGDEGKCFGMRCEHDSSPVSELFEGRGVVCVGLGPAFEGLPVAIAGEDHDVSTCLADDDDGGGEVPYGGGSADGVLVEAGSDVCHFMGGATSDADVSAVASHSFVELEDGSGVAWEDRESA